MTFQNRLSSNKISTPNQTKPNEIIHTNYTAAGISQKFVSVYILLSHRFHSYPAMLHLSLNRARQLKCRPVKWMLITCSDGALGLRQRRAFVHFLEVGVKL